MPIPSTGQIGFTQVYQEINDDDNVPTNYGLDELAEAAETAGCTIGGSTVSFAAPYAMNDFLGMDCGGTTAPDAPSDLFITNVECNNIIDSEWVGTTPDDFELAISVNGGAFIVEEFLLGSVQTDSYIVNDTDKDVVINEGDTVQFRIRARDTSVTPRIFSNPTFSNTITYEDEILFAPTSVTASQGTGTNEVDLTWQDNSSVGDRFEIQRSSDEGSSWAFVANVNSPTTSYTDTVSNGTYIYRVRSFESVGTCESGFSVSNEITIGIA